MEMSRAEGGYGIRLRLPIGNGSGLKSAGLSLTDIQQTSRFAFSSTRHDPHTEGRVWIGGFPV